eukprot:TRINITY_DN4561_c1_g1_i4.p1 TRINITY_DN4561_c1_g1~~TRINITY_DN4561_c1_g1_i4.p1  ORF type:complete len:431 (+),score=99.60 TRINITY_DN4561_c1_g1_i4:555-1847(+)
MKEDESKEATRLLLDEYYNLTDSEVLLAASSTERLRIAAKIGEMKQSAMSHLPSGIAAEMEILERDLSAADDNNRIHSNNSEGNPLILKPSHSVKRRRGYQVGHITRASLDNLKGSRLQLRCDPIQQPFSQRGSQKTESRPITCFAELRTALDSVPFGYHPLLADPPDIGIREIPPKATKEKRCFSPKKTSAKKERSRSDEDKGAATTGGANPPPTGSSPAVDTAAHLVNIAKIKELVSERPEECYRERTGNIRQERINLGNLVVNEEQLKSDIQRDLPNVWGVEVQYEEAAGKVDAVLVFSYVSNRKEEPTTKCKQTGGKELDYSPSMEPKPFVASGNVGKEQRPLNQKTEQPEDISVDQQQQQQHDTKVESPRNCLSHKAHQHLPNGVTFFELILYIIISIVCTFPFGLFMYVRFLFFFFLCFPLLLT